MGDSSKEVIYFIYIHNAFLWLHKVLSTLLLLLFSYFAVFENNLEKPWKNKIQRKFSTFSKSKLKKKKNQQHWVKAPNDKEFLKRSY